MSILISQKKHRDFSEALTITIQHVNRNIVSFGRIFAKEESASRIAIHTFKSNLQISSAKLNETSAFIFSEG